ncbi:FAD binding domain-containing protein [Clostridium magnum]|uniref:Nicotinate dehydrogenase FAD-subunit n=1 Tax=Clostridium magnum DSM 2767 TaxID=1121326 RepID=A0A162R0V3_9CLOT|nr:FAD binding domain-containing protein [Clostridium magnum]KZL89253.1 nicotinate dehydrogenase FAD-subunit [Clostridium magnum DSM 2767]SHI97455.1 carbon-monoxide dehydrogenase medium subunit [Clostridium magnum DSM 2767]
MSREFFQPKTLNEALKYRRDYQGAALLAGGTDLVVNIHKGKGPEGNIIDLSKIEELKEIEIKGDKINIGAMATFTDLSDSKILMEKAMIICKAAKAVGSPQIRNKGTIGGNICNASPAADVVPTLTCLEAKVELKSIIDGDIKIRVIAVEEFIVGSNKTLLEKDEILTNIIFKIPSADIRMDFEKIGRRNALAIARLNGACLLNVDNNRVTKISLVIGSAISKPERFSTVEDYLIGKELNDEVLRKGGMLASDYVLEQTGRRSSSTYKLPVIAKFTASLIENTLNKED